MNKFSQKMKSSTEQQKKSRNKIDKRDNQQIHPVHQETQVVDQEILDLPALAPAVPAAPVLATPAPVPAAKVRAAPFRAAKVPAHNQIKKK